MSFKEEIRAKVKTLETQRRANVAFKNILKEKTAAASRRAYQEEAIKVAESRAREKARRPGIISQVGLLTANKVLPVRRPVVKSVTRRYAPKRRYAPARRSTTRRTTARRYAPRRRMVEAREVKSAYSPVRINDFI